jgi:hypothetical protein
MAIYKTSIFNMKNTFMRNKLTSIMLSVVTFFAGVRTLLADSTGNAVETHTSTSTTKTTTYTILGMDQTTGMIVIGVGVIVLILIVVLASRSSSKTETTIIK